MTLYALTSAAEADLAEIADFIATDSPQAAIEVLNELRVAMDRLADMPGIGHRRRGLSDDVRLWPVRS